MQTKNITLKESDLLDYIYDNFQEDNLLEISFNRVFLPGKILSIDKEYSITTLQLKGELLNQTVDVDFTEILHEIVELRYTSSEMEYILTIIN